MSIAGVAHAAGPFGSVNVGGWVGGAFSNDETGAFSHCAATAPFINGFNLVVAQNAAGSWLLSLANPGLKLNKGETSPLDVVFDGHEQVRLYATANPPNMVTAILPLSVTRTFQKASLMVVTSNGSKPLQFALTSTGALISALANCATRMKAEGLGKAGDFTKIAAKPQAAPDKQAPSPGAKSGATKSYSGTGFVVSSAGHIVTNNHVIDGCRDIKGNLTGESATALRVVSRDEVNDLALLQAPSTTTIKDFVKIRDRSIRSGDSVVAIGFPYHGLLTSDFTVTTGIVSSLSGLLNDTRHLQISAAVQPGNSGGPLFDTSGQLVGVVVAKLDARTMIKATGTIPENVNFAIKTGALRDFLDNSVVPYQTAEPKGELKTTEIASNARAYTMLISCTGASVEQVDAKR
jgi:S1-C subfamily serine protease